MIFKVHGYELEVLKNEAEVDISNNLSIVFQKTGAFYILLLDPESYSLIGSFIFLEKPRIYPKLLKYPLFTNYDQFWNIYIRNYTPKSFSTFDLYQDWLFYMADHVNVINMSNFEMFTLPTLDSPSETKNIETILNWFDSVKSTFKNLPIEQIRIYNFFNFTLFQLSKRSLSISKAALDNEFFTKESNQILSIDLLDNRCKNVNGALNYYQLSKQEERWKKVKPEIKQNFLYKIDFSASCLQLLSKILDVEFDKEKDIYLQLKDELKLSDDIERNKIKQEVFSILFSNKIKNHLDIEFFKMCYYFSLVLLQDYKKNGYINTLISKKKLRLDGGEINRSKLFNMFIMSLETELYIGVLYNMLQFDRDKISPKVFIYDSIIFEIDVEWLVQNMKKVQDVLTFEGGLKTSKQLGRNLLSFENIEEV